MNNQTALWVYDCRIELNDIGHQNDQDDGQQQVFNSRNNLPSKRMLEYVELE